MQTEMKGGFVMAIREIGVQRFSWVSSERNLTTWWRRSMQRWGILMLRRSGRDLPRLVLMPRSKLSSMRMLAPTGLMEFARFDLGLFLRKASGEETPRIMRLVIGNPLIMKKMVEHVPDAGSYAPVTVLIDERKDGVHISYDRMASFLAGYGSAEASKVAQELDAKVEKLLTAAAG